MARVGIVTDSTCDLGPVWLAAHDVAMVPLLVRFGEREVYRDWIDLSPEQFYPKLEAAVALPKTSQPSPADFEVTYHRLAEEGAEGIVSIHLSARLSGTVESATLAAANSPVRVRVVDTKSASQGAGLVVKAAVEARDTGGDADAVEAAALHTAPLVRLYFVMETLDYLVKGGRAGKAQALAASVLDIKPVLHIDADGAIEPFKKLKGMRRAIEEIVSELKRDAAAHGHMRVALLHGTRTDLRDEMLTALEASGADYDLEAEGTLGAVIGTYTGNGAIGLAYHPKE